MTMLRQATTCAGPQSNGSRAWRFAEFFAGIGLMRIGLERADPRWRCVFANDLDPIKRGMYATHFGSAGEVDGRDVHQLPASTIPNVSLATASFPCTDLSIAGSQQGIRAGQSAAFWGFHRILEELGPRRPPLVLLENVTGFLGSNGGRDFVEVMRSLNALSYSIDTFVLDARWFVPQSRPRLFVMCVNRAWVDPKRCEPYAPSRLRSSNLVETLRLNAAHIDSHCLRLPSRRPPRTGRSKTWCKTPRRDIAIGGATIASPIFATKCSIGIAPGLNSAGQGSVTTTPRPSDAFGCIRTAASGPLPSCVPMESPAACELPKGAAGARFSFASVVDASTRGSCLRGNAPA